MSSTDLPAVEAPPAAQAAQPLQTPQATASYGGLLTTYIAAIFVSAALLFAVQPMFTKMILPQLGGAASVWSVAMVFFQTTLLGGYAYAHLLTRLMPGRTSVIIHLLVMGAACFWLPLHIATTWGRPPAVGEAFWLLGLFTVSIGLPFFALSANGPLLQAWFARTDHPAAKDPYFLYAASNVGSFLALIAYPVAIEPFIPLGGQTWYWTIGFYVLIALIAGCGALVWRFSGTGSAAAAKDADQAPPTWRDAATWIALAAVPSGLLLAVTTHTQTDVAAVPLLWVLPLALYLLTFVIVFSTRPIIAHWLVVTVQPVFVLGLIIVLVFEPLKTIVGIIAAHVVVFFVCALMCHGELARRRPAARHLTAYYMWISFGGMIGGIFSGLVAPHVFNWVAEYPLLLVLAVLCRPGLKLPDTRAERVALYGALGFAALLLVAYNAFDFDLDEKTFHIVVGALLVVTVLFWSAPLPFAAIIAFVLVANQLYTEGTSGQTVRSFFGVVKVGLSTDGKFRVLWHGTTIHGAQRIKDAEGNPVTGRPEVITYYYEGSAIAQIFDAVRTRDGGGPISYAVIGLGTGTLACKAQPGDSVDYFEIDPAIVRIARDPAMFSFVSECKPDLRLTMGDARLTLADMPDESYDIIVVDAFTSDAIPIHLLTREAMALYLKKLKPRGIAALHVSNRHLELVTVVGGIAQANGAIARVNDGQDIEDDDTQYKYTGTVGAVARNDEDFGKLATSDNWPVQNRDPKQRVWTDDYSNIVGSLLRRQRE